MLWLTPGEEPPTCREDRRGLRLFVQLDLAAVPEDLGEVFGSGLGAPFSAPNPLSGYLPVRRMVDATEAEWQLSSHPDAFTVTLAEPAPNLPLSPVTDVDQLVDGAVQSTCVENVPLIVTRLANCCWSVPLRSTEIGREHVTVPEIVAVPVRALTEPRLFTVRSSSRGAKTWTRKLPVATLPEASVAWHSTVVVPTGKNEPDEGLQLTVGFGSRSSLAVTE